MASEINEPRIVGAIRNAIAETKNGNGVMPVREVAHRVLAETDSEPGCLKAIIDALCDECIVNGVIIEFQPPGS
jgi:hypothetical protein